MNPFTVAYHHATPHGVLSAVHIPDAPDPVPPAVIKSLPPVEAEHALTLRGYRQVQFVGGRLALRQAFGQLGVRPEVLLPNDRGAVVAPKGFVASVSHKKTLAIGMVARNTLGTLGVDLEDYQPARLRIAEHVLTEEERSVLTTLPDDDRRWMAVLLRFSIKESIYKAIDPYVRRYVGFHEAIVHPDLHGMATVEMHLQNNEGPFQIDARYHWLHGRLLTSVRILPGTK